MRRPFVKMNGLGNDFVVVEAGSEPFAPNPGEARAIADRAGGIGCDQLIAIEPSKRADAFMRVWNADGGEVGACGNGARCAGWLIMEAAGRDEATIATAAGLLRVRRAGDGLIAVDMGEPALGWRKIPLVRRMSTRRIDLAIEDGIADPGCVSMGNPHVVFFVDDAEAAPASRVGPIVENHPLFPERANVGFAQIRSADRIRLRVWERGAGLTRACGTGACAAVVAACRRGLTGRTVTVEMDGGELHVEWREADRHVLMTGPVAVEFTGWLPLANAHLKGNAA
jgi:diaminopimelate epimerase